MKPAAPFWAESGVLYLLPPLLRVAHGSESDGRFLHKGAWRCLQQEGHEQNLGEGPEPPRPRLNLPALCFDSCMLMGKPQLSPGTAAFARDHAA
jgi:hypothetical protein